MASVVLSKGTLRKGVTARHVFTPSLVPKAVSFTLPPMLMFRPYTGRQTLMPSSATKQRTNTPPARFDSRPHWPSKWHDKNPREPRRRPHTPNNPQRHRNLDNSIRSPKLHEPPHTIFTLRPPPPRTTLLPLTPPSFRNALSPLHVLKPYPPILQIPTHLSLQILIIQPSLPQKIPP